MAGWKGKGSADTHKVKFSSWLGHTARSLRYGMMRYTTTVCGFSTPIWNAKVPPKKQLLISKTLSSGPHELDSSTRKRVAPDLGFPTQFGLD